MFSTPPSEALRRRLTAGAAALAVNLLIIVGLIIVPRPDLQSSAPGSLDVVFVSLPEPVDESGTEPGNEPVIEPEPDGEAVPEPEPADIPPEPEAEAAADPDPLPPAPPPDGPTASPAGTTGRLAEAPNILRDTNPFNDERVAIPFPGGEGSRESAVRSVFCLSTSDANRRALDCSPFTAGDGLPMRLYASEENIARGQAAMAQFTADQIRALLARNPYPGRNLAGQATLADVSGRPTASADQMRDTLPPLIPDPAFGD
ncbi:hypothetical protein [Maricaulis sp.]|uniref:hypothetical protein n=1 Tax=Maricaulis sp. TaxID=1486257 RepID=UPI0025C63629|nr:hypothetical protein [Maricaulis sp.]